jgi:diguanylate cyclase (GGDEF)-like protein
MAPKLRRTGFLGSTEKLSFAAACGILTLYIATELRQDSWVASPETFNYLQVACGLMALTVAGASFLRFYGDQDRFSLFLGFAFLVSSTAIFSTLGPLTFGAQAVDSSSMRKIPFEWALSQAVFALLLVGALVFGTRARFSVHPGREIALALLLSIGFAFLLSVVYSLLATSWHVRPGAAVSRPWNLIEIAVLLIPTIGFGRRCKAKGSSCDAGIFIAAVLTVACHIAASQSENIMDAPFLFAEGLKTLGYTAALGGVLVENARSFKEVRLLSARDYLTGLANYRSLMTVIESELQRFSRTGRQFAVLLADLDGLKTINDRYGHLVGNRALHRVADILRVVCRGTDTAARHGGDEFAVVLPESDGKSSSHVIDRIQAQLAKDLEFPPLSVSIGCAVCPADGMTSATLLAAADKSLYEMKHTHKLRLVSNRT